MDGDPASTLVAFILAMALVVVGFSVELVKYIRASYDKKVAKRKKTLKLKHSPNILNDK